MQVKYPHDIAGTAKTRGCESDGVHCDCMARSTRRPAASIFTMGDSDGTRAGTRRSTHSRKPARCSRRTTRETSIATSRSLVPSRYRRARHVWGGLARRPAGAERMARCLSAREGPAAALGTGGRARRCVGVASSPSGSPRRARGAAAEAVGIVPPVDGCSASNGLQRVMIPLVKGMIVPMALDKVAWRGRRRPHQRGQRRQRAVHSSPVACSRSQRTITSARARPQLAHEDLGHVAKTQTLGTGVNIGIALLEQISREQRDHAARRSAHPQPPTRN